MASCIGIEGEKISEAIKYYDEMLTDVATVYNSIHFYIYHVLCIIGVFANFCIVVVLFQPSMRRNPFNYFLIAIAICDMSLMASYLVFKQVELCHPWFFSYSWAVFTLTYACMSVFTHSASLWLTVNMAVLRYLVLRGSSKSGSTKLNNYKAALVAIFLSLLISLIGSFPNIIRYRIEDAGMAMVPEECFVSKYAHYYTPGQQERNYILTRPSFWTCSWERFSFWTAGLLLKIIPCLLLTIFMAMLVKMLIEARDRRSRLCASNTGSACGSQGPGSSMAGKSQAERTTAMLTIIVAVFLITELPQGIIVIASVVQPTIRFAMPRLGNFVDLLSLINSSVNFILYSTMSVLFRKEFMKTFGFCFPQPLKQWHSKRKLKSNGVSTRGMNSVIQTPTRKPHQIRSGFPAPMEQTECLILNGETTTNSV